MPPNTNKIQDLLTYMKATNDPSSPLYVPKYEFDRVSLKGFKHDLYAYKDHLLPNVVRNPMLIKNMNVNENDTFVVTFPKAGTRKKIDICL